MLDSGKGISDLVFSPGRPPQVEKQGQLSPVAVPQMPLLRPEDTARIAGELLRGNETALRTLKEQGACDLSYSLPERGRFRVNIFRQRGTFAIVMRVIASRIPTLAELKLPPVLAESATLKNGIVLVTGPTGSGKSSTLAAIIDLINETRAEHILTIEDPIEFLHQHKKATVHQRELHSDTPTFAAALKAALRQAPKVILVGEMRDRETIEIALTAAETGHLVFSTLHTIDASKTVDRIIGTFESGDQQAIRTRLANSFRYIVSQRLVPNKSRRPHRRARDPQVDDEDARVPGARRGRGADAARRHARRRAGRHAVLRRRAREAVAGRRHHPLHRAAVCHQRRQPAAADRRHPPGFRRPRRHHHAALRVRHGSRRGSDRNLS